MTKKVTIEEMAAWLTTRDDFVVMGHVTPDGDATGSTIALCHALRRLGKRAVVCLPGGVPLMYSFLPGADEVIETGNPLPFEPQTALVMDVSSLDRLGEQGLALFERCPSRAVIDHHNTNLGFGDVILLDGDASATCEIAVFVVKAMGLSLTLEEGECLFLGISTDTGHFNYVNTRKESFQAAEQCVAAGIDIARMTERLYRTRTQARTHLMGLVLAGLRVSEDGQMAWAFLTQAMRDQVHARMEDNEGIVSYLVEIEGVIFAVLVEERGNVTKLSMRSRAPLNVAEAVAVPLGGGGHARAAGASVALPMDEALEKALNLARRALSGE